MFGAGQAAISVLHLCPHWDFGDNWRQMSNSERSHSADESTREGAGATSVHVRVHAGLDRFFPGAGRVRKIEIADGATVGSLLRDHGVPEDLPLVVGLNRDLGSRDSELQPGDLVELVPPMTGG